MPISLSEDPQKLLEAELQSGEYHPADELIHAALDALNGLESHTLDDETLNAIDNAEDQIDRGDVHEWKNVREQKSL